VVFFDSNKNKKKLVVLIIMDGLGVAPEDKGNAVYLANTSTLDYYWPRYPHGFLHASGIEVGLPFGVPGNSEVCHLNIGAGKIVIHDLPRIDQSIQNGSFYMNETFFKLIDHVKKHNSNLHLCGLVGSGFAHSSINHLFALIKLFSKELGNANSKIIIHCFTDGRDSPVHDAENQFDKISGVISTLSNDNVLIGSVIGRYYAMDRDLRWDRTEMTYDLLVDSKGESYQNYKDLLTSNYSKGITDEFMTPSILPGFEPVSDNDAMLVFNFRSDRALQLTSSFVLGDFEKFDRRFIKNLKFATMSRYGPDLPVDIAFDPDRNDLSNPLAKILSDNNLKQLHISESEKFPHVTYFFNGENHTPNLNESWIEIPSPRDVPTYDKKPEMSSYEVTEKLLTEINSNNYDFILVNYANTDMVGHTGVLEAGIKAVESVDKCLDSVIQAVLNQDGAVIITADHGNIEEMINNQTGEIDTQHSIYPVPFLVISPKNKTDSDYGRELRFGRLADIAPTILTLFDIKIPSSMTGRNLLD